MNNMIGHNNPPEPMEIVRNNLTVKFGEILERATTLTETAAKVPQLISDDQTQNDVTDLIGKITAAIKSLEAGRTAEKEPFLTQGRAIDGFFKTYTEELERVKKNIQDRLTKYLKQKAMEEQNRRIAEAKKIQDEANEKAAAAAALEKANMPQMSELTFVDAHVTEQQAAQVLQSAYVKPAELAKAQGVTSSSSLTTSWVGEIVDVNLLDLEKLRPFIHSEALQKAINLFVKAGNRELKGANIYQKSEARVR